MSLQPGEGDFPRGGAKQRGKKRKLKETEKDLFKTEDIDDKKRRKADAPSIKTKEKEKRKKSIQQNRKKVVSDSILHKKQKKAVINESSPKHVEEDANTKLEKKKKARQQKRKKKKVKDLNSETETKPKGDGTNVKPTSNNKKRRNRKKKTGNKRKEKVVNELKEISGRVEKLYFARVEVGMTILGCVAKVDEYSLTFDLPGGLQGEVSITAVSDTYTEQLKKLTSQNDNEDEDDDDDSDDDEVVLPLSSMFQPGMIFPCKVVAIKIRSGSKKKIFLSMNPSVVNKNLEVSQIQEGQILSGTVTACEDHGYVVDVSVEGSTVFLAAKQAEKYIKKINNGNPLPVGQVLRCCVLSVENNLIKVGINPQKVEKSKLSDDADLEESAMQAGLQVTGKVKEVLKDGLSVEFCGTVGYVHRTHTTQYKHKKSFSVGDEVRATILFTLSNNSIIYLSLLPHLTGSSCQDVYNSFSLLADRKSVREVTALDALKKAVYFNMDGGLKALATLSSMSAVTDYKTPLHKMFKFGTKHSCTVVGFNLIEHVLLVRLQKAQSELKPEEEENKNITTPVSSRKVKRKDSLQSESEEEDLQESLSSKKKLKQNDSDTTMSKKDKKTKKKESIDNVTQESIGDGDKSAKKKKLKKNKAEEKEENSCSEEDMEVELVSELSSSSKKKKKKEAIEDKENIGASDLTSSSKKKKKKMDQDANGGDTSLVNKPSSKKQIKKKKKQEDSDDEENEEDSESGSEAVSSKKKVESKLAAETRMEDAEFETPRKKKKKKKTAGKKSAEETDSGVEVNKMSDSDSDDDMKVQRTSSNPPRLSLSTGFSWSEDFSVLAPSASDDSSNEEEEEKKSVKKTSHELRRERMEEEKAIFAFERQLLEGDQAPETTDDFDRLALQSPNSSMVWTRYMAFHLETVEIDKARAVAERALKTISFREEQEKLNIWVAYLNLENLYGGTEQLRAVFDRAVLQNEPIKVYKQMVQIYISSNKMEEAEKMYNTMCKKFSQDKTVWTGFAQFFFKNNRLEAARKLLQRCLKCLENREHVEMISKFAQLEYKYGEAHRGCTMFENILTNYPKRTDLWSVYIDMVIKTGSLEDARCLFERVIHMKMSSKKMQFFFKKYLEFEKKHGDARSVEKVKQKAVDYVESQGFTESV